MGNVYVCHPECRSSSCEGLLGEITFYQTSATTNSKTSVRCHKKIEEIQGISMIDWHQRSWQRTTLLTDRAVRLSTAKASVVSDSRYAVKTTPHKTIFAVWISTRNSRTGEKLNKLVQRQQLNWWSEVQSENPNNVWRDLKHLGNLWA